MERSRTITSRSIANLTTAIVAPCKHLHIAHEVVKFTVIYICIINHIISDMGHTCHEYCDTTTYDKPNVLINWQVELVSALHSQKTN